MLLRKVVAFVALKPYFVVNFDALAQGLRRLGWTGKRWRLLHLHFIIIFFLLTLVLAFFLALASLVVILLLFFLWRVLLQVEFAEILGETTLA